MNLIFLRAVSVVFMRSAMGIVFMSRFNPITVRMCSFLRISFDIPCNLAVSRALPSLLTLGMINACFCNLC